MGNFKSKNQSRHYRTLSPSSETDCSAVSIASNRIIGKRLSRLPCEFSLPAQQNSPPKSSSLINFPVTQNQPEVKNYSAHRNIPPSSTVIPNVGLQIIEPEVEKKTNINNNRHSSATPSTNKGHRSSRMPPSSEQHHWIWKVYDSDNDGHLSEPDMRQLARTLKEAFYSQAAHPLGNTHSGYKVELKISRIKNPASLGDNDEVKPSSSRRKNLRRIPEEVCYNLPRKDLLHPVGKSACRKKPSIRKEQLIRLVEESHARNNIPIRSENIPLGEKPARRRANPSATGNADLVVRHDHIHHFPSSSSSQQQQHQRKMTLI